MKAELFNDRMDYSPLKCLIMNEFHTLVTRQVKILTQALGIMLSLFIFMLISH